LGRPGGRPVDDAIAARSAPGPPRARGGYFDVGITNSAPCAMLAGQRCMIDFWRV
jgi:hypothetical protein